MPYIPPPLLGTLAPFVLPLSHSLTEEGADRVPGGCLGRLRERENSKQDRARHPRVWHIAARERWAYV